MCDFQMFLYGSSFSNSSHCLSAVLGSLSLSMMITSSWGRMLDRISCTIPPETKSAIFAVLWLLLCFAMVFLWSGGVGWATPLICERFFSPLVFYLRVHFLRLFRRLKNEPLILCPVFKVLSCSSPLFGVYDGPCPWSDFL